LSVGSDVAQDLRVDQIAALCRAPIAKEVTVPLLLSMGCARREDILMRRELFWALEGKAPAVWKAFAAVSAYFDLPPIFKTYPEYVKNVMILSRGEHFIKMVGALSELCRTAECPATRRMRQLLAHLEGDCALTELHGEIQSLYNDYPLQPKEVVVGVQLSNIGVPQLINIMSVSDKIPDRHTLLDEGDSTRLSAYTPVPTDLAKVMSVFIQAELHGAYPVPGHRISTVLKKIEALPTPEFALLENELIFISGMLQLSLSIPEPRCAAGFSGRVKLTAYRDPLGESLPEDIDCADNPLLLLGSAPSERQGFLRVLGRALFLNSLGIELPAFSAELPDVSGLYTHFMHAETYKPDQSRLTEALLRIKDILSAMPCGAAVLMDEPMVGTGLVEGQQLCLDTLNCVRALNGYAVLGTHNTELSLPVGRAWRIGGSALVPFNLTELNDYLLKSLNAPEITDLFGGEDDLTGLNAKIIDAFEKVTK
jgi:hypothetical protein